MLKRLLVGLFVGAALGAAVAAGVVQGLGVSVFASAVLAYAAAAATGVLTGLVAGKPLWTASSSAEGRIEAGLKAFAGGLLALGGMFALRQWVHVTVDLSAYNAGADEIGRLPATSLPLIAAVLSSFFELDNTPSSDTDTKQDARTAATKGGATTNVRVAKEEDADEADSVAAQKKAR